jgi:hypothetical protein
MRGHVAQCRPAGIISVHGPIIHETTEVSYDSRSAVRCGVNNEVMERRFA